MKTLKQIQEDVEEIEVTKDKLKNTPMPESEKIEMMEELDKYLGKLKKEKRERMFYGDWSEMCWRPKEKREYIIRILPQKVGHKGSWFQRVNKHFVWTYSPLGPEVFICNYLLFGEHCSICEFERRMQDEYGTDITKQFTFPTQQVVMNIVVRGLEGVKVWEAPKSAFKQIASIHDVDINMMRRRKLGKNVKKNVLFECDLKVNYDRKAREWERYKVGIGETRPMGTEEEKQQWLGQVLELIPEVLYKPVEDSETSALLGEVKELMERVKREAYFKTPEGQAETERGRQEEREKREKEEKEKAEAKRRNEESRNNWREMIKDGSAAEEFKKESKKDVEGWSTWDILNELFIGEKDWDELAEMLSQQLKEKAKAKK